MWDSNFCVLLLGLMHTVRDEQEIPQDRWMQQLSQFQRRVTSVTLIIGGELHTLLEVEWGYCWNHMNFRNNLLRSICVLLVCCQYCCTAVSVGFPWTNKLEVISGITRRQQQHKNMTNSSIRQLWGNNDTTEEMIARRQEWFGHLMPDYRLPKSILLRSLPKKCLSGGPRKCWQEFIC